MKKLLFSMALFLSLGMTSAFAGSQVKLKGYIDDSMCAGAGKPMHGSDRESCAKKCMKMGAKAVLVSDGKVYKITNQKEVTKFAGKDVIINGKLDGDTIDVTTVTPVKA